MFRIGLTLLAWAFGTLAMAQTPQRALVILRFNQPQVYYEQPLYEAISKAVALKQTVNFDVVSYAPATGTPQIDAAWQQTASHNVQAVLGSMQRMGVPAHRIRVAGQQQPGLAYDEVHVFVR